MKKSEALGLIAALKAAFPRYAFEQPTVDIYVQRLEPLPYDAAKLAVKDCIDTCVHPPAIAEIRLATAERILGLPTAIEAWADVHDRVIKNAALCSVLHPLAREVAKAIGWSNLNNSTSPDTVRAHFMNAYNEQRKRAVVAVQTDTLEMLPKGVEVRAQLNA